MKNLLIIMAISFSTLGFANGQLARVKPATLSEKIDKAIEEQVHSQIEWEDVVLTNEEDALENTRMKKQKLRTSSQLSQTVDWDEQDL